MAKIEIYKDNVIEVTAAPAVGWAYITPSRGRAFVIPLETLIQIGKEIIKADLKIQKEDPK
jgi:hypothetical protein